MPSFDEVYSSLQFGQTEEERLVLSESVMICSSALSLPFVLSVRPEPPGSSPDQPLVSPQTSQLLPGNHGGHAREGPLLQQSADGLLAVIHSLLVPGPVTGL